MMQLKMKRIYDGVENSDGYRVLTDRLWPRGLAKKDAHIDVWAKKVGPSTDLRKWFHQDRVQHWQEFQTRYENELGQNSAALELAKKLHEHPTVTLLTASKELTMCHVPILLEWLKHRQ